jgi:hypothetical protein
VKFLVWMLIHLSAPNAGWSERKRKIPEKSNIPLLFEEVLRQEVKGLEPQPGWLSIRESFVTTPSATFKCWSRPPFLAKEGNVNDFIVH